MKIFYSIIFAGLVVLCSCKSDSPLTPENSNSDYYKLYTIEESNVKFELYSSTANTLKTGYNDLGFKVFINSTEKTNGFVKFFPKMYHFVGSFMHSSPVSPSFLYDQSKSMFMGYTSFFMISDSNSHWYGFFNYNDVSRIDSVAITVDTSSRSQIRYFVDYIGGDSYYLTLVSPYYPKQGPNVFKCLLHLSNDDINYTQIDNAQMFIRPWMEAMGHGSSNNVNPVYKGGGIYEGSANFNMSGIWDLYDSVKVNNVFITPAPPPRFTFDIP
jgi:hypothetical protein